MHVSVVNAVLCVTSACMHVCLFACDVMTLSRCLLQRVSPGVYVMGHDLQHHASAHNHAASCTDASAHAASCIDASSETTARWRAAKINIGEHIA